MKNIFKAIFGKKKSNSMTSWADREVQLAIEKEREAERKDAEAHGRKYNPKEFSYGGSIYESALKAYKSMAGDGHSGCSWGFTKQVLTRLMDGRPLTPLKGTDDEWINTTAMFGGDEGETMYQNVRCSSVFKTVKADGTITYGDVDLFICVDTEDGDTFHFGLATREAEAMFPIKFPYMPPMTPYKVFTRLFDHVNAEPGCYDTAGVFYVESPDGTKHTINKFYKEDADNNFVQIDYGEYEKRRAAYEKAKEANKEKK